MEKSWRLYNKKCDYNAIATKYGIDPVTAQIMRNRDIISDEEINLFLNGTVSDMHDASLMKDMTKAASIMKDKILAGKSIRIISDYDVDGVTSNYVLYDGLKKLGADVSYQIPDRVVDGYGINEKMILKAVFDGVDTIITCDNGISAMDAIKLGKDKGLTIIVTDHHEMPYHMEGDEKVYDKVPADAVVDPKQPDCEYPFEGICGAVVAYKFMQELHRVMGIPWGSPERYMEIIALGTTCDVMELMDENRIIVKEGLRLIKNTKITGLRKLMEAADIFGKTITTYHLGFIIGPCINATGRLDSAERGLRLLLEEDPDKAMLIAEELVEINNERKGMTVKGVDQAVKIIEEELINDNVLVVYIPGLHESLAGIVAGRIKEKYYRPTYVLTDAADGSLKGSGRSIKDYDMFEELSKVKDLLTKYGGHKMAAGLTLPKDKLGEFRELVNANENMSVEILTPKIYIDVKMPIGYITIPLLEDFEKLGPFGTGNPNPIFAQKHLRVAKASLFGKEQSFIRLNLASDSGDTVEAVDFDAKSFLDSIKMWFGEEECDKMLRGVPSKVFLDVAYRPSINEYRGRRSIQLLPEDYSKSE